MSNYRQPFPPPQGPFGFNYYGPVPRPLAAARRASIVLWILGPLMLSCGACIGIAVSVTPMEPLLQQLREYSPEQAEQFSSPQMQMALRAAYILIGVAGVVVGLAMTISAFFVRQARRGAIVVALIACAPVALWAIFTILQGLLAVASGLLIGLLPLIVAIAVGGIIGLTVSWLLQGLRAGGLADQQQLLQQQYWQYLQQQSQGYGYGMPGAGQQPAAPWANRPPGPPAPPPEPSSGERPGSV